jgi:hypothetical protein
MNPLTIRPVWANWTKELDMDVMNSPNIAAILAKRLEQASKHGHSPADDAQLPLDYLVKEAIRALTTARENIIGIHGEINLTRAQSYLHKAGGLNFAAADRLDLELSPSPLTEKKIGTVTPLLSTLREPPIVGRFYMVPTVDYHWDRASQKRRVYPVLGPLHHDKGPINFPHVHYHVDGRFLSTRLWKRVMTQHWLSGYTDLFATPISQPDKNRLCLAEWGDIPRKPTLKRLKCTRVDHAWPTHNPFLDAPFMWGLNQPDGTAAMAIHRPDGRTLCPHRKVDLSSFAPDADGIHTCPLHGMRVDCRKPMVEAS